VNESYESHESYESYESLGSKSFFLTSLMFRNYLYVDIWLTVVGQANMEPGKRGRTIDTYEPASNRGSSSSSLARLMPPLGEWYQPERDEPQRTAPTPGLLQSAFDAADSQDHADRLEEEKFEKFLRYLETDREDAADSWDFSDDSGTDTKDEKKDEDLAAPAVEVVEVYFFKGVEYDSRTGLPWGMTQEQFDTNNAASRDSLYSLM